MSLLQTSNHLLGPKPFPLDRLLAIFYSVVDSRVAPTASIFSQVGVEPRKTKFEVYFYFLVQ